MTFVRFLAFLAVVLMSAGPLAARAAAAGDEDNTPPVEDFLETRRYTEAATREVLGQFSYVVGEVDGFPGNPSPDKVKKTFLRKRLLDLRLMIDLNAFAYKQGSIDRYRELVDLAYEAVGAYKDLFDVQAIDGLPIDPVEQDRRLNAMNDTIAPFRQADVREKLEKAVDHVTSKPTDLDFDTQPRLWQIAQLQPVDSLDSAGNAARLGQGVLAGLRAMGMTVDDIFDPAQEVRFHDVRKALRSVLVLSDMFPSLTAAVADTREPLSDLVKAYGKANDQVVAYHAAQANGQNLDDRAAGVTKAFEKAQEMARQFDESGQLDAFSAGLGAAQGSHQR